MANSIIKKISSFVEEIKLRGVDKRQELTKRFQDCRDAILGKVVEDLLDHLEEEILRPEEPVYPQSEVIIDGFRQELIDELEAADGYGLWPSPEAFIKEVCDLLYDGGVSVVIDDRGTATLSGWFDRLL